MWGRIPPENSIVLGFNLIDLLVKVHLFDFSYQEMLSKTTFGAIAKEKLQNIFWQITEGFWPTEVNIKLSGKRETRGLSFHLNLIVHSKGQVPLITTKDTFLKLPH